MKERMLTLVDVCEIVARKEARNWRKEGDRVAKVAGLTVKFLR